jgi:NAD(P)-dependent dehydrogenase (short-subunit alcohol dehydrogenase family)
MPIDPDLLGLEDAVALVTGGAQSIGRGCAVQLARAGCHIAIVDIADAGSAVAEIEGLGLGRRAVGYRADLRDRASVEAAVLFATRSLGPLQVAWVEAASKAAPLGRLGETSEAGGVAVFLASKLSSYLTGHPIPCDGGILHTTSRPPIGMTMVPAALAGMVGDRRISREAD